MESAPLLEPGRPVVETARYYVLIMYCMITTNQCLFWFTFSSATTIQEYYNMPDSTIDLFVAGNNDVPHSYFCCYHLIHELFTIHA